MHPSGERIDHREGDAVARALVRVRRIGETIAKHNVAAGECRLDHVDDVLAARREHQKRLGLVGHRAVQQPFADRLARRRAAGLARGDDPLAARRQRLGEEARVRALAGAVDAFERDEAAAGRMIGQGVRWR